MLIRLAGLVPATTVLGLEPSGGMENALKCQQRAVLGVRRALMRGDIVLR